MLDPLFASEHGPWRTARVPHMREPMDGASEPWVRQITFVGSTQIGKSEFMNNVIGYYLQHRPSPAMMVLSNDDAARLAGERRIMPMIRSSRALRAELTGRPHDAKRQRITLRRSVLYLRGAHSPTGLASVPVRLVVCDETEKWPDWSGDEASPLSLVRERQRTFYDSLLLLASTPNRRGGIIDREFERGDQRRYYVPCPHCSRYQVFRWAQVRWNSESIKTEKEMREQKAAHYECEHCHAAIDDAQKTAACAAGVWVPEGRNVDEWIATGRAADRTEHRSYHIWAAYSPWLAWWQIVAEFLRCTECGDLMNWVNSWLGELWEDRVTMTDDKAVIACIDRDRDAGEVPDEVRVVTAAIDVQENRLEWMVQGWGLDEESWVIEAGRVPLMADREDWKTLGRILFQRLWGKLPVRCCFVDSRYRREEVMDFCRLWQPTVRMIAGVEREGPELFGTRKLDRHPRTGLPLPNAMLVWTIQVGWFKDLVAGRLARAISDPDVIAGRIHLPNGLPEGWLRQIASEHKVRERSGKKHVMRWVLKAGHLRNEAWDLLVYNAAAARQQFLSLLVSPGRLPDHLRPKGPPPSPPPRKKRPPFQGFSGGGRR